MRLLLSEANFIATFERLLLSVGPYILELCGKSFRKFKLINSNPHQGKLLFVSRESLIALFCLILFTDGLMSLLKQIGQGTTAGVSREFF